MYNFTVNISQKVTDRANIDIANKLNVKCWLSITGLKFSLTCSKGQLGSWNGVLPNIVRLCTANKRLDILSVNFCTHMHVAKVRSSANFYSNRQRS